MKKTLLICLAVFGAGIAHAQAENCTKALKTGTFLYEGPEGKVEIVRSGRLQTETYNGGASKLVLNIKWLNDYTYELTHKESINAISCLDKGDKIVSKIIGCKDSAIYCESQNKKCGDANILLIKVE